ncbi:GTP-binding protein [Acinetobacter sp. MB5]|uniref:GTP-binding protein n=1 Tax=Acinetobacter sp. MB5 TaxID=2069438 RepID=UPI000DD09949|nr:ATP/GTP-binding protein [Acinetobacter sp. MB5]
MILQQYKIVFGGTMGSGKSTAIRALSEIEVVGSEAVNTDAQAHVKSHTTVGIEYGEITLSDGIKVGLYGTPGQDRFDFIWSVICQGAIGSIVLIDHQVENPLEDLAHYLSAFRNTNQNIVIGITHVDKKIERPTLIYREWLEQQNINYPLFFIDARLQDDVLLLVEAMVANTEVNFT